MLDYAHAKGKPDFFMFGEVYDADPAKLSPYVRDTDMSSVLDFTFQSSAVSFANGGNTKTLQTLYAGDDRYTTPDSSATALPTFLGNHDMGRVGYMLQSTPDALQRDLLAHDLMFLGRGQPVVYYGDEQGFVGTGGDKDARQSLFASQVPSWSSGPAIRASRRSRGAGSGIRRSGRRRGSGVPRGRRRCPRTPARRRSRRRADPC